MKNLYHFLTESSNLGNKEKLLIAEINNTRNNFLSKVSKHKDFDFILKDDIVYDTYRGDYNKCETNAFQYLKTQELMYDYNHFRLVGGYAFTDTFFPIEHYWVYDTKKKKHIEVTPLRGDSFICYAGIINQEIKGSDLMGKKWNDIKFLLGGQVYFDYFQ